MKSRLGLIALSAALMEGFGNSFSGGEKKKRINVNNVDTKPKDTVIPKGCTRYYFDKYGNCYTSKLQIMAVQSVLFETTALSKKSAIKKFNKFVKTIK